MMRLLLLLTIFLSGCYTQKKAISDTDKAILKFPAAVLTHLREQFPCIEKPIVHITDSTAYKQWQDSVKSLNVYYDSLVNSFEPEIRFDTIQANMQWDSIRCNILRSQLGLNIKGLKKVIATKDEQIKNLNRQINNARPIHDTVKIFVEDAATEKIIKAQERDIADIKLTNETWKGKAKTRQWIMWFLILIIGVQLYFNLKKLKIPFLSK